MRLTLKTPVQALRMVGPVYARRLKKLNIDTIFDLLYHPPRRYQDYSHVFSIRSAPEGKLVTIQGNIIQSRNIYTKSRKIIQKVLVADQTGQLEATWFNQPFIPKTLRVGERVSLAGMIERFGKRLMITSPDYEVLHNTGSVGSELNTIHTGRLVPIYPETSGVSSKWLRSRIAPLLPIFTPHISEWLPETILNKEQLIPLSQAVTILHFPQSLSEAEQAVKRLAFDEMLSLQLTTQSRRKAWNKHKLAQKIMIDNHRLSLFLSRLPFTLTKSQEQAIHDVLEDLKQDKPMNRLLVGDVGSGKTVVAAVAAYAAFTNAKKTALMAPTEILALQHLETIRSLLIPYGTKIAICTAAKKENLKNYDIIIGTHALLYKTIAANQHALVIIDEQHRFGVEQRAILINMSQMPHTLTMTATPIPRTVALTLYGDLDLSTITEMPPGRVRIKTWVIPAHKRESAYSWIKQRIKQGEQAFIVCPLIEESTHESMLQIRAATDEFNTLKKDVFPSLRLSLLHGRLKSSQKEEEIQKFRNHKTHILVTTPVVEVGIDIPSATIMMIEGAERFGLSQLHQLRGRVGRGTKESYCLLFPSKHSESVKRLRLLESAKSGSELAEIDLKLRGPGEIYGTKQHGFIELRFAKLTDAELIATTQAYARQILEEGSQLQKSPRLKAKLSTLEKAIEPN